MPPVNKDFIIVYEKDIWDLRLELRDYCRLKFGVLNNPYITVGDIADVFNRTGSWVRWWLGKLEKRGMVKVIKKGGDIIYLDGLFRERGQGEYFVEVNRSDLELTDIGFLILVYAKLVKVKGKRWSRKLLWNLELSRVSLWRGLRAIKDYFGKELEEVIGVEFKQNGAVEKVEEGQEIKQERAREQKTMAVEQVVFDNEAEFERFKRFCRARMISLDRFQVVVGNDGSVLVRGAGVKDLWDRWRQRENDVIKRYAVEDVKKAGEVKRNDFEKVKKVGEVKDLGDVAVEDEEDRVIAVLNEIEETYKASGNGVENGRG